MLKLLIFFVIFGALWTYKSTIFDVLVHNKHIGLCSRLVKILKNLGAFMRFLSIVSGADIYNKCHGAIGYVRCTICICNMKLFRYTM